MGGRASMRRRAARYGAAVVTATAGALGGAVPPALAAEPGDGPVAGGPVPANPVDAVLPLVLPVPIAIPDGDPIAVDILTTGGPFGLLWLFGANPYWVPAWPAAIAAEIAAAPYNDFDMVVEAPVSVGSFTVQTAVTVRIENLRVAAALAFGNGALATDAAYDRVVAALPTQPGGTASDDPAAASLSVLPMLLLRNPGRPDGGIVARFAPILEFFGIHAVTRDRGASTDGNAALVPIKVDATVEYDPVSDFAAWPNLFTLANNLAALFFPTYILRGVDLDAFLGEVKDLLVNAIVTNAASVAIGDSVDVSVAGFTVPVLRSLLRPIVQDVLTDHGFDVELPSDPPYYEAVNAYVTAHTAALPLLEILRLPTDLLNVLTCGVFGFTNPIADALEPALKLLVNLGYSNVTQDMSDPLNPYPRVFDTEFGSTPTPFSLLPGHIDWRRVPGDLLTALVAGIREAFFSGGIPGIKGAGNAGPNPIQTAVDALLGRPPAAQSAENGEPAAGRKPAATVTEPDDPAPGEESEPQSTALGERTGDARVRFGNGRTAVAPAPQRAAKPIGVLKSGATTERAGRTGKPFRSAPPAAAQPGDRDATDATDDSAA